MCSHIKPVVRECADLSDCMHASKLDNLHMAYVYTPAGSPLFFSQHDHIASQSLGHRILPAVGIITICL